MTAGRPFPWFRPRCRRKEVRPATIPYRCVRTRQGRDYVVVVPALVVPQCGHCKEVVVNYAAEEQIARALEDAAGKPQAGVNGGAPGADARRAAGKRGDAMSQFNRL